jgi:hypothetical protein
MPDVKTFFRWRARMWTAVVGALPKPSDGSCSRCLAQALESALPREAGQGPGGGGEGSPEVPSRQRRSPPAPMRRRMTAMTLL